MSGMSKMSGISLKPIKVLEIWKTLETNNEKSKMFQVYESFGAQMFHNAQNHNEPCGRN